MDTNEFLNNLSEKGKLIVREYFPKFKKRKIFTIEFSNESKVVYDDINKYQIFIKSESNKNIEYIFFHEFFHCVQYEEDFPNLYCRDEKYEQIANDILSYILDYNVRYRLEKYSYNDHISEKYIVHNALFKYFTILKDNKQISAKMEYIDQLNYGMAVAMIAIMNNNMSKTKKLLSLIKTVDLKVYNIYQLFYKNLTEYDYNSKEGVFKIFKSIIQELHLENYISIRT